MKNERKVKDWLDDVVRTRLLHLIWLVSFKKYETIKENSIPYIKLPVFLTGSRSACVIHHRLSGKTMIFLSKDTPFNRYTIYHEYREGQIFGKLYRNEIDIQWIIKLATEKINIIYEISQMSILEISKEMLDDWANFQVAHVVAILDEIELAREEMSLKNLEIFYEDIRKHKSFGWPIGF